MGTKSARRHLKCLSGRERRFKRDTNHCLSKRLVLVAKGTSRGLALEDLTHLRSRSTVHRHQRDRHSKWAFRELRAFISYKASLAGIPVVLVDPRGTSRTCSRCGHEARGSRRHRDRFVCRQCHYEASADLNAAINIANRAAVNQPIVSTESIGVSPWTALPRQGQALSL